MAPKSSSHRLPPRKPTVPQPASETQDQLVIPEHIREWLAERNLTPVPETYIRGVEAMGRDNAALKLENETLTNKLTESNEQTAQRASHIRVLGGRLTGVKETLIKHGMERCDDIDIQKHLDDFLKMQEASKQDVPSEPCIWLHPDDIAILHKNHEIDGIAPLPSEGPTVKIWRKRKVIQSWEVDPIMLQYVSAEPLEKWIREKLQGICRPAPDVKAMIVEMIQQHSMLNKRREALHNQDAVINENLGPLHPAGHSMVDLVIKSAIEIRHTRHLQDTIKGLLEQVVEGGQIIPALVGIVKEVKQYRDKHTHVVTLKVDGMVNLSKQLEEAVGAAWEIKTTRGVYTLYGSKEAVNFCLQNIEHGRQILDFMVHPKHNSVGHGDPNVDRLHDFYCQVVDTLERLKAPNHPDWKLLERLLHFLNRQQLEKTMGNIAAEQGVTQAKQVNVPQSTALILQPEGDAGWTIYGPAEALDYLQQLLEQLLHRPEPLPIMSQFQANLGLASTGELLDELKARVEINGTVNYRTVEPASLKRD